MNPFARLRIVADDVVQIDIMLRFQVATCGGDPMTVQGQFGCLVLGGERLNGGKAHGGLDIV